jgi:hypothetical protein
MQVFVKGVRRFRPQVGLNAANGEIHEGQLPGVGVGFFPVHTDVAHFAAVGLDKLFRLDEHATGPAAGVIDAAFIGGQHGHQHPHYGSRGVELTAPFAFGAGEHAQKVFIDAAQGVSCLVFCRTQPNSADEVYQFT